MGDRGGLDPYEGDDWARYGGARPKPSGPEAEELLRDDPFADYRRENGPSRLEGERGPRRARSNLVGALVALSAIAVVAGFVSLAAPKGTPSQSPGRTPPPAPTPTGSPLISLPRPTLRMAHVAVEIPLPLTVAIPDPAFATASGSNIYLAGNLGAFPVDASAGTVGRVWSGGDFPKGLRRLIYDRGIWISAWPSSFTLCGPPCWDKATTYRVDPVSGAITLTLERTYLIGAQYDGVYVATLGRVETLDPTDGHVLTEVIWKKSGEPRLGCGGVWSVEVGGTTELRGINMSTGDQFGGSSLPVSVTYGPISSEGLCWMMSGHGGASAGQTELVLLDGNGRNIGEYNYSLSMVVLDSEFWTLFGSQVQRFEVLSGAKYGQLYMLPIVPEPVGDPSTLFSAVGSLWLYRGQELIGFDVLTGSSN